MPGPGPVDHVEEEVEEGDEELDHVGVEVDRRGPDGVTDRIGSSVPVAVAQPPCPQAARQQGPGVAPQYRSGYPLVQAVPRPDEGLVADLVRPRRTARLGITEGGDPTCPRLADGPGRGGHQAQRLLKERAPHAGRVLPVGPAHDAAASRRARTPNSSASRSTSDRRRPSTTARWSRASTRSCVARTDKRGDDPRRFGVRALRAIIHTQYRTE